MFIYQVLPRYWGGYKSGNVRGGSLKENGCGHFSDMDDASLEYIRSLGCSHVWFTGVIRHSTHCDEHGCIPSHPQFLKGEAGSPYAIVDYYDVNPYLADNPDKRMEEFVSMIERAHAHSLRVLLDFVPNHVSRDNVNFGCDDDKSVHWKAGNDFFYYPGQRLSLPVAFAPDSHFDAPYDEFPARATGNDCFRPDPSVNDWYETVKLNYCDFHTGTWDKMFEILRFWLGKGVDGFRCDMVELVPPEFFKWLIAGIRDEFPSATFVAEVYDRNNYRRYLKDVGFDLLYDKSGLYDILRGIVASNAGGSSDVRENMHGCAGITGNWQFLGDLQEGMLNFLENHDEQRVCSDWFASSPDRCFAALAVSMLFNKASFMLYAGQETGERGMDEEGFSGKDGRSTIFDWWKPSFTSTLWRHIHGKQVDAKSQAVLDKFLKICSLRNLDVFCNGEVYDLCFCNVNSKGFDRDRHFAFLRYNDEICYLVVCNFSSAPAEIDVNVPIMGCRTTVQVPPFDYKAVKLK